MPVHFRQHVRAPNGVLTLPAGWQSPDICCFNWPIRSLSNRIRSLFLSSKHERGMSGNNIRRKITQTHGWNTNRQFRIMTDCVPASLKGYWERKVGGIYPLPQEGAHPTGDGVLHCPLWIYNPVITFFFKTHSLMHKYVIIRERCIFIFWKKKLIYIYSQTKRPKLLAANAEMLLGFGFLQ